jgi:quercetin dioxygenase-like cupin family protein
MKTADIMDLEMLDAWYEMDPTMRIKVNFPFFAGTGNETSSVVYFEIEPGRHLGIHTDSAEEILLIIAGSVEARIGDEVGELAAGHAALVPAMVPHSVRTLGDVTAKCVGFFSAATVVSTFEQPMMPFGQRAVGTPPVEATV